MVNHDMYQQSGHYHSHAHDHADHYHYHAHDHDFDSDSGFNPTILADTSEHVTPAYFSPAVSSFLAVVLISAAPILLVYLSQAFFALCCKAAKENRLRQKSIMNFFTAFAVGALLGDVFLHAISHIYGGHGDHGHGDSHHDHSDHDHAGHSHGHGHNHSHGNMKGALYILIGVIVFFLLEKASNSFFGGHDHHGHGHSHGHSHGHAHSHKEEENHKKEKEENETNLSNPKNKKHRITAYLNLLGDGLHNMTDGIALAVAFQQQGSFGLVTTFAIFLHEIPHEISDFTILMKSGYSLHKAAALQFITAIFAVAGWAIGVKVGQIYAEESVAITAGGFLYIALYSLMSQLFEEDDEEPEPKRKKNGEDTAELLNANEGEKVEKKRRYNPFTSLQTTIEVIGMSLGIGFMYYFAQYEETLEAMH